LNVLEDVLNPKPMIERSKTGLFSCSLMQDIGMSCKTVTMNKVSEPPR